MNKKKAYVIGTNVSTSLSPTIFHYWFNKFNVDGEYGYIEIKEKNFDKEINSILKDEKVVGLNITIPYKEKIIPHIVLDKHANKIGAVNYIARLSPGVWHGCNSDYLGFEKSIKPFEKQNNIKTAIVIGYGGASKAIIYSLQKKGAKIKLFNRSYEKINNLRVDFVKSYKLEDLEEHTCSADLIINTTPVNVLQKSKKQNIGANTVGFDLVYRPKGGTGFLNNFDPDKRIDGIYMLAHQAEPCWNLWFGNHPISADEDLINFLFKKMEKDKWS